MKNSKIKNFKKFNESIQDDTSKIEKSMSESINFWIEKSGWDQTIRKNAILIDFRSTSDWDNFHKEFGLTDYNHPSMIHIKNYVGVVEQKSVCQIYKTQLEVWIDSGSLSVKEDSLVVGFELDLGGGDINDFLFNIHKDYEDEDYTEDEDIESDWMDAIDDYENQYREENTINWRDLNSNFKDESIRNLPKIKPSEVEDFITKSVKSLEGMGFSNSGKGMRYSVSIFCNYKGGSSLYMSLDPINDAKNTLKGKIFGINVSIWSTSTPIDPDILKDLCIHFYEFDCVNEVVISIDDKESLFGDDVKKIDKKFTKSDMNIWLH